MAKISAGLLLFRRRADQLEVFIVHPGGPFWKGKDLRAWTIPKGMVEEGEDPLGAAKREFREETGFDPPAGVEGAPYLPLGAVKQKSGKAVHAWAFEGDADPAAVSSNLMSIEWPPRSGKWIRVPEVDAAAWLPLEEARPKLIEAQCAFLDRLAATVGG